MNLEDILNSNIIESTLDLYTLKAHVEPELGYLYYRDDQIGTLPITINVHFYHHVDHCRFVRVSSVWVNGRPCMVFRDAGRDGEDYQDRFIVDEPLYWEMIRMLQKLNDESTFTVTPLEQELPALSELYRMKLTIDSNGDLTSAKTSQ